MTGRERRSLWLGLLTIVGAWLLLRGGPRVVGAFAASNERLAARRNLLAETRAALASLPRMEDSAKVLTAAVAGLAPRILSGNSAAVALSDLSGRLGTIAGRHHARLLRVEPAPGADSAGALRRVAATAEFESDFQGLAELLAVLAQDTLVIVVDRLQVSSEAASTTPPSTPERLEIELRLSAWYLVGGGSP
jgi:hypothetical protein